MIRIISVVNQKGMPKLDKITSCKMFTTRYSLAVAPNVLLRIKTQ